MTYTYAILEVSASIYDEIADRLREVGYDHAFDDDGYIDMHGIALAKAPEGDTKRITVMGSKGPEGA